MRHVSGNIRVRLECWPQLFVMFLTWWILPLRSWFFPLVYIFKLVSHWTDMRNFVRKKCNFMIIKKLHFFLKFSKYLKIFLNINKILHFRLKIHGQDTWDAIYSISNNMHLILGKSYFITILIINFNYEINNCGQSHLPSEILEKILRPCQSHYRSELFQECQWL